MDAGDWISLAGLIGGIGAFAVGYGRLDGRTKALEDRMLKVEEALKAVSDIKETIGRLDERTKEVKQAVDRIEDRLAEPPSFQTSASRTKRRQQ